MSKNINKLYDKAMEYYRRGNIEKALQICETGIARDLKDKNLLNLKGLLLYLKGDLDLAVTVWKINKDFNNDEIAKLYIDDARNDNIKVKLYKEASLLINNNEIDLAVEKLNICKQSDFNKINVCYLLSICYLRKGNYKISKEYNDIVLSLDKNSKLALDIEKELSKFIDFKKNKKGIINIGITLSIIIVLVVGGVNLYKFINTDKSNIVSKDEEKNNDIVENNNTHVDKEEIGDINNEEDIEEEKEVVEEIKNYTNEEIEKRYYLALDLFEDKKYDETILMLEEIYNNQNENYLNNHILFLIGSSYKYKNDIERYTKIYEEYINRYYGETYTEEVLYTLALKYKDEDIEKSKSFAEKLYYDYSESMYLNTKIDEILNN